MPGRLTIEDLALQGFTPRTSRFQSSPVQATERTAPTPPAIYVTWDDALALHHAGADGWSAANVLCYLGERARARGDRQRTTSLLETA